jgi:hypothetical protein
VTEKAQQKAQETTKANIFILNIIHIVCRKNTEIIESIKKLKKPCNMNSHLLSHRMPQAGGDVAMLQVGYCLHP